MRTINIQDAKTHLSRLVDAAHGGEQILIAKHGKPLARLSAYSPRKDTRPLGGIKIKISDDFDDEDEQINKLFGTKSARSKTTR